MIRTLNPFDLIRLSISGIGNLQNLAKPHRELDPVGFRVMDLVSIKPLLGLAPRRYAYVQTRGLKIRGLALAQDLGSSTIWEVVILAATPESRNSIMDLLNGLTLGAGQKGVDRLFLRIVGASPCRDGVSAAGFSFYLQEYLFRRNVTNTFSTESEIPGVVLQPVTHGNEFSVYQIYNAVFPFHVREVEGQTLEYWKQTRDRNWQGRNAGQFLVLHHGRVVGWVGTREQGRLGFFNIMIRPGSPISFDDVLPMVENRLAHLDTVLCLASEFANPLMVALETRGYTLVEEYSRSVRRVTARIKRPSLVPIGAE